VLTAMMTYGFRLLGRAKYLSAGLSFTAILLLSSVFFRQLPSAAR